MSNEIKSFAQAMRATKTFGLSNFAKGSDGKYYYGALNYALVGYEAAQKENCVQTKRIAELEADLQRYASDNIALRQQLGQMRNPKF